MKTIFLKFSKTLIFSLLSLGIFQSSAFAKSNDSEVDEFIIMLEDEDQFLDLEEKLQDEDFQEKLNDVVMKVGKDANGSWLLRNLFALPAKAMLWNHKVSLGPLKKEDQLKLSSYLKDEGLTDTTVSINQYNPGLIWSKTWDNKRTSFLGKLIFGNISALYYTLSFQKVLGGGDHYNQYANVIVLFSDDLNIALHEAGHAKDFKNWEWKDPSGVF